MLGPVGVCVLALKMLFGYAPRTLSGIVVLTIGAGGAANGAGCARDSNLFIGPVVAGRAGSNVGLGRVLRQVLGCHEGISEGSKISLEEGYPRFWTEPKLLIIPYNPFHTNQLKTVYLA